MTNILHTTLPEVHYKDFVSAENAASRELIELGISEDDLTDERIAKHIQDTMTSLSDEWWTNIRYSCPPHTDVFYWLVVADLGLWYGRRSGCRVFCNLQDALFACVGKLDDYTVSEDYRGNVTINGWHHDGHNIYRLYRLSEQGVRRYRRGVYSLNALAENSRYRKPARLAELIYRS